MATATNSVGAYSFAYDDAGRVVQVSQPFGVSQTFAYDGYGNRVLVIDSLGGVEESIYNGSQLVRRTLTQGAETLRIDFTYDGIGRVKSQTRYSDAAGTTLVATTTFEYDVVGRVVNILHQDSATDAIAEFTYVFDEAGQLDSWENFQIGIDEDPWTLNYSYDGQGQLTGDGTLSYDYDLGGNRDTGYTYVRTCLTCVWRPRRLADDPGRWRSRSTPGRSRAPRTGQRSWCGRG